MKELGEKEIPCFRMEGLTESEKNTIVIRDNFVSDSPYIQENIEILFKGIDVMDLQPFQMNIEDEFKIKPDVIEELNAVPEVPEEPKSKLGEIYQLGRHKIMCGDCTKDIHKLLGETKIDQLVTDPPYGVNYSAKNEFLNKIDKGSRIQKNIQNDNIEDYRNFFTGFLSVIPFSDYNTCYIFMAGLHLHELRMAIEDSGITCGDYLVWVKNNHVLGRKDYNPKHEFIVYGWKGRHKFYGKENLTTVFEYDKPLVNDLHPTMKPVEILVKIINDGSSKNAYIYDPFLGSGSTLIACEQTGRTCYGMEIDPAYIDVIIQRWENYTEEKAIKVTEPP